MSFYSIFRDRLFGQCHDENCYNRNYQYIKRLLFLHCVMHIQPGNETNMLQLLHYGLRLPENGKKILVEKDVQTF